MLRSSLAIMIISCIVASLSPARSAAGLVELLHDNFDDNSLDAAKWTTNTAITRGPARVEETNHQIEFDNRGHLLTAAQYNPVSLGLLLVSGRWTFLSPPNPDHDILSVLTRSDGLPSGTFSDTSNGIEFQANQAGELRITERVNGVANQLASVAIAIDPGDTFWFSVFDNGQNVSFSLTELNGNGASATVSAMTSLAFPVNHVVFHNREATQGFHTAYLDQVSIEAARQVPEPSTLALATCGILFGLSTGATRRRKCMAAQDHTS